MSAGYWEPPGGSTPPPDGAYAGSAGWGDLWARFDALYRSQRTPLVRLAYLLVGSRSVADDLAQDAFIRLYPSFPQVAEPVDFLRRTLVHLCLNWRSQDQMRQFLGMGVTEPPPVGVPEIDETWAALVSVPADCRTILVLHYYAQLTLPQIEELTGWRPATVRTGLQRGLTDLSKALAR